MWPVEPESRTVAWEEVAMEEVLLPDMEAVCPAAVEVMEVARAADIKSTKTHCHLYSRAIFLCVDGAHVDANPSFPSFPHFCQTRLPLSSRRLLFICHLLVVFISNLSNQ